MQARFNNSLCIVPLRRRIAELTVVLRECNIKELEPLLLSLIENIFGIKSTYANSMGWLLHTIVKSSDDFDAIFTFLHPQGVLFEAIYKVLGDFYLKYEFQLSYLPQKFMKMILDGKIPPFYMDKIQIDSYTRSPTALALSILLENSY